MTALLDLQSAFRDWLVAGVDAALPSEVMGGPLGAAARMGVYRNNMIGNLTAVLRITYPAVCKLVGEEFFAAAAMAAIGRELPGEANLYRYGAGFAAFLDGFPPARGLAYLGDVARLEWAVGRALHAPPASAPLDGAALAALAPEFQAGLVFRAQPSLALLELAHPALEIWQAVLDPDSAAGAAGLAAIDPAAGGAHLAVALCDGELVVLRLSQVGFGFARALCAGQCLADALADIPPDDAAPLLGLFLGHGFFCQPDNGPGGCVSAE